MNVQHHIQELKEQPAEQSSLGGLTELGAAMARQLQQESEYLDSVVAFSLQISHSLGRPKRDQSEASPHHEPNAASNMTPVDRIRRDYQELSSRFVPIATGRQHILNALRQINQDRPSPLGFRQLAAQMPDPLAEQLLRLRGEIESKIQEIQSISIGNQAVLIYTMDFYYQLLTGVTGEAMQPHVYNALGQMAPQPNATLIEKEC